MVWGGGGWGVGGVGWRGGFGVQGFMVLEGVALARFSRPTAGPPRRQRSPPSDSARSAMAAQASGPLYSLSGYRILCLQGSQPEPRPRSASGDQGRRDVHLCAVGRPHRPQRRAGSPRTAPWPPEPPRVPLASPGLYSCASRDPKNDLKLRWPPPRWHPPPRWRWRPPRCRPPRAAPWPPHRRRRRATPSTPAPGPIPMHGAMPARTPGSLLPLRAYTLVLLGILKRTLNFDGHTHPPPRWRSRPPRCRSQRAAPWPPHRRRRRATPSTPAPGLTPPPPLRRRGRRQSLGIGVQGLG